MSEFKVGDKVRHYIRGEAEVSYGPFSDPFGRTFCVIRLESGREEAVPTGVLAAVPTPPKFAVGDTVALTTRAGALATVEYGPFDETDTYVVRLVERPAEAGEARTFTTTANVLRPVDEEPIKVGDRVRVVVADPEEYPEREADFVGRVGTVTHLNENTTLPYRVKFGVGHHGASNGAWWCQKVERIAEPPADTYEHDGVTYDLSARYRDREGDVWSFTGKRRDGTPTVTLTGDLDNWDTIVFVEQRYGPLTKITD